MQNQVEDIKAKILKLAISGKLVKQDPTDETAEILYEKIQKEKEKLIKDKKIRRVNLEEIKEEEIPFELPDSWKWVKLEDISSTIPDKKFQIRKKDIIDKGMIPVISQSKELIIGYSDLDDKIYTVDNGVIIFGDHTRIIKYINFNFIVGADGVKIIKPFNQLISEYFHYSLIYNASITENRGYSRHFKYFKKKLVALPPLNEQKRIVEKIDELFSLIDNMTQVKQDSLKTIDLLEEKVLDLAIKGKLVEQDSSDEDADILFEKIQEEKEKLIKDKKIRRVNLDEIKEEEIPFEIPDNWKWAKLGETVEIKNGFAYKSNQYIEDSNNLIIRIGNVKNGQLILNDRTPRINNSYAKETINYKIEEGCVLITMTGTKGKRDYFYTHLVKDSDFKGYNLYLNQRVCMIENMNITTNKYLNYIIKSKNILNSIFKTETGSANQGNISICSIRNLSIPLPPLDEQKRIVAKLDTTIHYLNEMREKLNKNK